MVAESKRDPSDVRHGAHVLHSTTPRSGVLGWAGVAEGLGSGMPGEGQAGVGWVLVGGRHRGTGPSLPPHRSEMSM